MTIPLNRTPGTYRIVIFNGEANNPLDGTGYFDGKDWSNLLPKTGTYWHPNLCVLEIVDFPYTVE